MRLPSALQPFIDDKLAISPVWNNVQSLHCLFAWLIFLNMGSQHHYVCFVTGLHPKNLGSCLQRNSRQMRNSSSPWSAGKESTHLLLYLQQLHPQAWTSTDSGICMTRYANSATRIRRTSPAPSRHSRSRNNPLLQQQQQQQQQQHQQLAHLVKWARRQGNAKRSSDGLVMWQKWTEQCSVVVV